MKRRTFLRRLSAGTMALWVPQPLVSGRWYTGRAARTTDVLIYGGGTGGICAAIEAARQGVEVTVVEPSPWIGGMLTAAGVSAMDGNKYAAGGGLLHTFRERLAAHYGSMESLFTGWVSLYCFEPKVGHRILNELVAPYDNLTILREADVAGYERSGPDTRQVTVTAAGGDTETYTCAVFIDATEYGDGLAVAGLPYRLMRESQEMLGESAAPETPDRELQDMTYAATLVARPQVLAAPDVSPQDRAYWDLFDCSTDIDCSTPDPEVLNHTLYGWERFITYGALPNDKFMLNWPFHSNDYPVNVDFFEDRFYRRRHLAAAKQHTLQYIKYMQAALGHPEWQLATDEYPTADGLPPIPYIRESRRLVNNHIMVQQDVVPVDDHPRAPVIDNSVAVGDYFLDHHHAKSHLPPSQRLVEDYSDNAPFQVPITVFFPDEVDERVLAGEKNIAVSHIVNGCTRLQPVVMLMGQALGAIAAEAVQTGTPPPSVNVRTVQETLIDAGCQIYLMYDVYPDDDFFAPVQHLALAGVLRSDDATWLEPDEPMARSQAQTWAARAGLGQAIGDDPADEGANAPLTRAAVQEPVARHLPEQDPVTRSAFVSALHAALDARS